MGIEEKLRNAKPSTWLTDGLSDYELNAIKFKTSVYLLLARGYIWACDLIKKFKKM